jgi:sec-independent protein translocase protein TatC
MFKYILEIKNRLFLLLFTCTSTLIICYLYKETLIFLLVKSNTSFTNSFYFIFTNVTEVFSVCIQLVTFLSFQIFFIYVIYHIFTFLNLAMFKIESYYLKIFLKYSLISWIFSIFLTSFILVPITWNFFLSFQNIISSKFIQLHFEAKLNEYLNFYIFVYYLCVFYCQIFTILFFFLNYINNKIMVIKKFRKLYYYFFVIFSTMISPPDIFSQTFIIILIILIYELFVFIFLFKDKLIWQPIKTN